MESFALEKDSSACVELTPEFKPWRLNMLRRKATPSKGLIPISAITSPTTVNQTVTGMVIQQKFRKVMVNKDGSSSANYLGWSTILP